MISSNAILFINVNDPSLSRVDLSKYARMCPNGLKKHRSATLKIKEIDCHNHCNQNITCLLLNKYLCL